jgi:Holliday junction resolvase RuvA-like protein
VVATNWKDEANMNDLLHILLGAALICLGVLTGAIADRIRGVVRARREHRDTMAAPAGVRREQRDATPVPAARPAKRGEQWMSPAGRAAEQENIDREVVSAALVSAGYSKKVAEEAISACAARERETIETWTRAALRRCMRQEASS